MSGPNPDWLSDAESFENVEARAESPSRTDSEPPADQEPVKKEMLDWLQDIRRMEQSLATNIPEAAPVEIPPPAAEIPLPAAEIPPPTAEIPLPALELASAQEALPVAEPIAFTDQFVTATEPLPGPVENVRISTPTPPAAVRTRRRYGTGFWIGAAFGLLLHMIALVMFIILIMRWSS